MNTGKAILGVVAGIAAGAVLGVLLAPGKGSETRRKLSKKGEDLADAVNDRIDRKFEEMVSMMTGKFTKPKVNGDAPDKTRKTELVE